MREMKNAFDGLLVDWIWLRKESLRLKRSQQNAAKLKRKENKRLKKKKQPEQNIQELWGYYQRYDTHVMRITKGEERGKKYLKQQ